MFDVVGRQYRLVDQATDLVRQEQEDGPRFQSRVPFLSAVKAGMFGSGCD